VAPIDASKPTQGVFDGLCLDGVGNIWVARWSDERIVGFSPDGKQIANIKVPLCKSPTIPCFGGESGHIRSAHDLLTRWISEGIWRAETVLGFPGLSGRSQRRRRI
jgi:sugar lactone lactonase YvrE